MTIPSFNLSDRATIVDRFKAFHAENKHVYQSLRRDALALKRAGIRRFGMKALFEKFRYDNAVSTKTDDFKLNNDFTALYARMLMHNEPELEGFFETRGRKTP